VSSLFGGYLQLLRSVPSFRALFLATFGSGIGTMLAVVALTVDVYERTGSGRWVSALLIADFLPSIAIGLLLGPFVDRLSRRNLLIAADVVRFAAFAALPFAPSAGWIVALALVVGFANGFFAPAANAGLPNLVEREDLPRANSLVQATSNLTWMLGPLLGGMLLAFSGPGLAYAFNAATFLVSAGFIARIPASLLRSDEPVSRGHWRDLADGFEIVRRSRALLTVAIAWTMVMLANASINVSEVFLVREALDGGNLELGILMGGAGLGLSVGSLLAAPLLERRALAGIYGGALLLMAAGYGIAAAAPSVWVALPPIILAGVGNGIAVVCNPLLVQWGAPDRLRGRAFTIILSVNFVFLGLGMAVAGPLTDAFGARWLWAAASATFAAAAVVGTLLARGVPGLQAADGDDAVSPEGLVPVTAPEAGSGIVSPLPRERA
jgi:MFS family permease